MKTLPSFTRRRPRASEGIALDWNHRRRPVFSTSNAANQLDHGAKERTMIPESIGRVLAVLALGACVVTSPAAAAQSRNTGKPQLTVRVSPPAGFVPFRAVFTAELVGGANDYEDYYCARVEWDWADETRSEAGYDCEPYEKGKSEIRRRFTQEHTYRVPGNFEVTFRLKQGTKIVAAGKVMVQVRD
jgi:hypothetical protein